MYSYHSDLHGRNERKKSYFFLDEKKGKEIIFQFYVFLSLLRMVLKKVEFTSKTMDRLNNRVGSLI